MSQARSTSPTSRCPTPRSPAASRASSSPVSSQLELPSSVRPLCSYICAFLNLLSTPTDPDDYDFAGTRAIATYEDSVPASSPTSPSDDVAYDDDEKKDIEATVEVKSVTNSIFAAIPVVDNAILQATFKRASWYSLILTLIVAILGISALYFAPCCFTSDHTGSQCPCRCSLPTMSSVKTSSSSGSHAPCMFARSLFPYVRTNDHDCIEAYGWPAAASSASSSRCGSRAPRWSGS